MNDKSKAPNFLGLIDENNQISLSDYKGSFLVLYFYPKDKTSGCTIQSQDFRDYKKKFANKNCKIIGISRDSIKSHKSFTEKKKLYAPPPFLGTVGFFKHSFFDGTFDSATYPEIRRHFTI